MDGVQFRHEQLEDPVLASIPVVVVSGADRAVDPTALGADAFLPKPVELDLFLDAMRRFCR
jgi:CheY-like chemotaxis protein